MSSEQTLFQPSPRQIHLNFHNPPEFGDLAVDFDAAAFARTFREAHIQSVTVFAKCQFGMCYYPATTGTPHPGLGGRDLLGEQIEALHREGLRAPIYFSVARDEDTASRRPEWRQVREDGSDAIDGTGKGKWTLLNFANPEFQDYIEAQLREITDRYGSAVDGFFFDHVAFHPQACWSDHCRALRERQQLTGRDAGTQERFESVSQRAFARRFTQLLGSIAPARSSVYYNAPFKFPVDTSAGLRLRLSSITHYELESLPTAGQGYLHLPRTARALRLQDVPWVGKTGRFHKGWGDFGGLKSAAALEYECFRIQALGGAVSIGDELHPRGSLPADAYDLIHEVYAQCEAAEEFYAGSVSIPQFGTFSATYPGVDPEPGLLSEEGAIQMSHEVHYDAAVVDERSELSGFPMLQLADCTVITPVLGAKLRAYHQAGGKLLISHRAGIDADGNWALDFLPLNFGQSEPVEDEIGPTFWRAKPSMVKTLGTMDRVCYQAGLRVLAMAGTEVVAERVLPYSPARAGSIQELLDMPPQTQPDPHPAIIKGDGFIYFADPIFREYRQTGNLPMRDAWRHAMEALMDPPPFGAKLPTTILSIPRRRGDDLILTLLHYIPIRKAVDLDVIEERSQFADERLHLPDAARVARVFGGAELARARDGAFILPPAKGRLLIEVPGYFKADR